MVTLPINYNDNEFVTCHMYITVCILLYATVLCIILHPTILCCTLFSYAIHCTLLCICIILIAMLLYCTILPYPNPVRQAVACSHCGSNAPPGGRHQKQGCARTDPPGDLRRMPSPPPKHRTHVAPKWATEVPHKDVRPPWRPCLAPGKHLWRPLLRPSRGGGDPYVETALQISAQLQIQPAAQLSEWPRAARGCWLKRENADLHAFDASQGRFSRGRPPRRAPGRKRRRPPSACGGSGSGGRWRPGPSTRPSRRRRTPAGRPPSRPAATARWR